MKNIQYTSYVGSLMYTRVSTCPDITFVMEMLGRYQSDPKWIIGGQPRRSCVTWKRITWLHTEIEYMNSNFTRYLDGRKSTSGYVFLVAGGAMLWKSVKQSQTLSLIMHVDFMAGNEATCGVMWLQNFVSGLLVVNLFPKPLRIFHDNSSAIIFSKENDYWIV